MRRYRSNLHCRNLAAERHGPDCAVALIKQATAIGFGERLADDIEAEPDFFDDMAAALEALDDTIVEDWLERIADWQERLEEFRVRRAIAVARMMRADDCNADQEAFALRLADRSDTLDDRFQAWAREPWSTH